MFKAKLMINRFYQFYSSIASIATSSNLKSVVLKKKKNPPKQVLCIYQTLFRNLHILKSKPGSFVKICFHNNFHTSLNLPSVCFLPFEHKHSTNSLAFKNLSYFPPQLNINKGPPSQVSGTGLGQQVQRWKPGLYRMHVFTVETD